MELFKLFGTIAVDGVSEATAEIAKISQKAADLAREMASRLGFDVNINTDNAEGEFADLTHTIRAQEQVLEALKKDYASVVLAEGKNSESAKNLARQIDSLSGELKDNKTKLNNATRAADQLDNSLDDVSESAKKSGDGFTVMKGAIANLISNGIQKLIQVSGQLIGGAVKYQSQMEQYTTSFTVMTGSAEKAVEVTERLQKLGAATPFEMTDLADATQLLMNYGFTADDAVDRMMMLGDISQGSAEKMNRIAMAYGQMSSAGKVSLEDVKQMIEAGFNPLQEISQTTGESMASLYDRISKGKISVDEITESMQRSTAEGGKYFGSMDAQSKTLEGRLSTLKDTVNQSLGTALVPILEKLANEVLPKVTAALEKVDWETFGQKAGEVFEKILNFGIWVIDNFDTIIDLIILVGIAFTTWKVVGIITAITKALNGMTIAQWLLNAAQAASPITWIIMAIAALIAIIILCIRHWDDIKKAGTAAWEWIKNAWNKAANWFNNNVIKPIANFFSNLWNGIKNTAINAWNGIKTGISNTWNGIKNAIVKPIEAAKNAVKNIIEKIKGFFNFKWSLPKLKLPKFNIKPAGWKIGDLLKGSIPKLGITWAAKGGIFDEPTLFDTASGTLGVGEAGAEAVAPIDTLTGYVGEAVKKETNGLSDRLDRLTEMLSSFFPKVLGGMDKQIVLDGGALVGRIAPQMNVQLGNIQKANTRGR